MEQHILIEIAIICISNDIPATFIGRKEKEMSKKERKKRMAQEAEKLKKEMKKEKARKRRKKLMLLALVGGGAMAAKTFAPKPTPGSGTVTLKDEEPGPLSTMISEMVKTFIQDPRKKAIADKMQVSIAIQDLDNLEIAMTATFKGSDITIANGVEQGVDIYIGTELALLLSLAGAGKGLEMLKWLRTEDGKKIVNAVKSGRLKIRGLAKKPTQMMLFQKFLTPSG